MNMNRIGLKLLILMSPIWAIGGQAWAAGVKLDPQYRLWKTSYTTTSDTNVMLSSSPIIVHGIDVSSPTLNVAGASFFALYDSSADVFQGSESTKTFKSLNSDTAQTVVCSPCIWDVAITSHAIYNKQGAAKITILWDWLGNAPTYRTGHEKD